MPVSVVADTSEQLVFRDLRQIVLHPLGAAVANDRRDLDLVHR